MAMKHWKMAGLVFVFTWFILGGIAHFVIPGQFLRIMPPTLPYPLALIYISGGFELLGAIGLLVRPFRKWAGYGLILLTICVTPANLYMWLHPELFPSIPVWALFLRLPVQAILIWVIWQSTRPDEDSSTVKS